MNSIAFIILLLISMYSSVYLTKYLKEKNKINNFSSELIVVTILGGVITLILFLLYTFIFIYFKWGLCYTYIREGSKPLNCLVLKS